MFRKAERAKAKLRLGICGPAGSGKSLSSLLIAKGLGGPTFLIDSEAGSGDTYADKADYQICTLASPFTPERYVEAIKAAESAGAGVIIIDSLSHAWAGDGGVLDQQGKMADKEPGKNSYTAWRHVTPRHNKLIEAILQSKAHIIATMRTKTEYALVENDKGKLVPQKMGMAPIQREGTDYEFGVVLDLDTAHNATATKDRTGLFGPLVFTPSEETGKMLAEWLGSGKDPDCVNCTKLGKQTTSTVNEDGMDLCGECHGRYLAKQTAESIPG